MKAIIQKLLRASWIPLFALFGIEIAFSNTLLKAWLDGWGAWVPAATAMSACITFVLWLTRSSGEKQEPVNYGAKFSKGWEDASENGGGN